MSATVIASTGRYGHIDAMRALAVMLVVVAHTNVGGVPGGSGVTIFFTISGFIITLLLLRERDKAGRFDLRGFYVRRLLKLAPPFLLIILIPSVVFAALGGTINWAYVASQTFFFFNWVMFPQPFGPLNILPGSSVVWSLSIEEQFYIVFAAFWIFLSRTGHYLKWLTVLGLAATAIPLALRIYFASQGGMTDRIYVGTDTRADALAIGVLTAVAYVAIQKGRLIRLRGAINRPSWLFIAIGVYIATLLVRDEWVRDTFRYTFQALAAATVILWGLIDTRSKVRVAFGRVVGIRAIQVIGLASYSIYLVHAPLNALIEPFLERFPTSAPIRALFLIVVGTGTGVAIWQLVERPVERFKNRSRTIRDRGKTAPPTT